MFKPSRQKSISFIVRISGTLISTLLFIVLISRQKWDVVFDKAVGIAFWAVLLALLFYLLSFWFNTLRWCILLWAQGVSISLWQAYRLTWAGNFASNFLPSTIGGDGFRMLAVHPYTGRKTISIGSVVLDRIINMASYVCLIPAPLIIFGASLRNLLGVPGFGTGLGFAITLPAGLQKLAALSRALVEKYFPKIVAAFRAWASKPLAFLYAFLAAWPSNLIPMAATYLLAHQLGMNVSFWQVMGVQTVTYFVSVMPISVNGYGLREVAYTTLYAALGASVEQASTLALVTRLLTVLATIPGAIWLSSAVTNAAGLDGDPGSAQGGPGSAQGGPGSTSENLEP
jgi:uncharacterized membrane protein YbhN (UPF0104 family)